MSQFFWKIKLRVLLDRLTFNSGHRGESGDDVAAHLTCLEEWMGEGRSQQPPQAFTNPELKSLENARWVEPQRIPLDILTCSDARKVFWWFWRCYPQWGRNALDSNDSRESQLQLNVQDSAFQNSAWSQVTLGSALRAERLGYFTRSEDYAIPENPTPENLALENCVHVSRPYLACFTFASIQELIQASCTLRDIQIGSWLSHYLSARICWKVAWKYGPDIFLSPCLYAEPLIDGWLLQQYPDFSQWISMPTEGIDRKVRFPNKLTLILPDNGFAEAMKGNPVGATLLHAEQALKQEWLTLGRQALKTQCPQISKLQTSEPETASLQEWESWLESWWQSCWVALPIADAKQFPVWGNRPSDSIAPGAFASGTLRQGLIQELHQQLKIVQQSQVWKIPTTFSVQSARSENAPELQSVSAVLMRGLSQLLPPLLGFNEASAIASLEFDRAMPMAEWYLLAAGEVGLTTGDRAGDVGNNPDAELVAYTASQCTFADFCNQYLLDLVERQYQGQVISASDRGLLICASLPHWEQMMGEIHQSFMTLNQAMNLRFGLVIAHRSVPRSIALKHLRDLKAFSLFNELKQSGIQVRLLCRNQRVLDASAEWNLFNQWRSLTEFTGLPPIGFNRVARCWIRHPPPSAAAIKIWVATVCDAVWCDGIRCDGLSGCQLNQCIKERSSFDSRRFGDRFDYQESAGRLIFCERLAQFLESVWQSTQNITCTFAQERLRDRQVQAWFYLAALTLRHRKVIAVEPMQNETVTPY